MDEREELIKQLKAELQWVKYRIRMLDIIEEKLLKMRRMAETAKESNLRAEEINSLNIEIHNLEEQKMKRYCNKHQWLCKNSY